MPSGLDILALGEGLVEFNQREGGSHYAMGFGGDTSNVVIAAARLGAKTGYISAVGPDFFGRALVENWAREGVDTTHIQHLEAPTGLYFITHDAQGHHFTYRRTGSAASLLTPAHVPVAAIRKARVLQVSAISQAISPSAHAAVAHAVACAQAAGVLVCYDTNLRLKLWSLDEARAAILEILPHVDILRPSLDDARQIFALDEPEAIVDHCLALGAKQVALTLGAAGTLVASRQARHRVAGVSVAAVDASGAGDAFTGAFLAALVRGETLENAARFANAAAAFSTTRSGASLSYGTRVEVERFMGAA